jgi:YdjC-like protein
MIRIPSESEMAGDHPVFAPEHTRNPSNDEVHGKAPHAGMPCRGALIVNADDWGRDRENTDKTLECISHGAVSSVSAMVFMEDSERAASIARADRIDAGLHLNFTTPFSASACPSKLAERQAALAKCLLANRASQVLFHPKLVNSFEYVVSAQLEQFQTLYGVNAERIDGHHHMHLCSNLLLQGLLPKGTIVRRNFTFAAGEKDFFNRLYRRIVDRLLVKRYRLTDCFFSLPPLEPRRRLERIFSSAKEWIVELETHPVNPVEFNFLARGEIFHWIERRYLRSFHSLQLLPPAS